MKKLFLFRTFLALGALLISTAIMAQTRVVGYLPTWGGFPNSINNVDLTALTHINVAFVNPTSTSGAVSAPSGIGTVVQQAHAKNVKVLISIAGGSGSGSLYYGILSNTTNTTNFINSLVQLTQGTNGVDGIDVDIEGAIFSAGVTAAMYENFVIKLAIALRAKGKLITCAIATSYGSYITTTAIQQYDFVNIMSYDRYGPWSGPGAHSTYQMAVNDLTYWNNKGVALNKLLTGVPFYGYGWGTNAGEYSYAKIVNTYQGAENGDQLSSGANQISYNGLQTIRDKTTYAKNNAGGVMIWELTGDVSISDSRSLLRAIKQIIGTPTNVAPTVTLTAPANNSTFTAPATVTVSANATDTDGSIASVQFFQGTTLIAIDNTAPYSVSWANVAAGTYSITAKATDNAGAVTTSGAVSITVTNPVQQSPYGGTAWAIPGTVEAENYDLGGQGVAYNDVTAANEGDTYRNDGVDIEATSGGGYHIGYVREGEWLEYTVNITSAGAYKIDARIATNTADRAFRLELDGVVLGSFTLPNGGAWANWQTVSLNNVNLTTGQKILRVYTATGYFNLDKLVFSKVVATNQPPVVNITAPVAGTLFTAPATIAVSANASDVDGSIASVQFYAGTTLIGTDNTAPYSVSWANVVAGTYNITAKATDNAGAVTTSTAVSINVNTASTDACSGIPAYVSTGSNYVAGSNVKNAGRIYECKPWPYSGWCTGASWAYAPGTGTYWADAWVDKGSCAARVAEVKEASENSLVIIPNPASDIVIIQFADDTEVNVEFFDTFGNSVKSLTGLHSGEQIAISSLATGIYTLRLTGVNGSYSRKLVKQ